MLFFLFSGEELREIFERLGYDYRPDTAARNVAYYDQRTSYGSTLSFVTYAGVLAAIDPESSWDRFLVALRSDVDDIQGGTTKEGIHLGVMAGTLDLVQRYYAGTQIRDNVLYFDPRLPERARWSVLPGAVPGDPDPGHAQRRPADSSPSIPRARATRYEPEYPATSASCARATRPCSSSARAGRRTGSRPLTERRADAGLDWGPKRPSGRRLGIWGIRPGAGITTVGRIATLGRAAAAGPRPGMPTC